MAGACQDRPGGSRRQVRKCEGAQMPGAKRFLLLLFFNMPHIFSTLSTIASKHESNHEKLELFEIFIHIISYHPFLIFKFYSDFFLILFCEVFQFYSIVLFLLPFTAL